MKRTAFALGATLLAFLVAPATALAGDKTDVCHFDADTNTYHLMTVSVAAMANHLAHGDAVPGDAVPGMDGYELGPNCEIVVVPQLSCPTEGTIGETLGSVWFWLWVNDVPFGYMGCVDTWPWFFNWGVQWDYFYGGAHLKFCVDAECSAPYDCYVPVSQ